MRTSTTLIVAKGLILTPERWGQRHFHWHDRKCVNVAVIVAAYGQYAAPVYRYDKEPAIVLLHAALTPDDHRQLREYALMANVESCGRCWELICWNDCYNRTHNEVIALLDRAIDKAHMLEGLGDGHGFDAADATA